MYNSSTVLILVRMKCIPMTIRNC